MTYNSKIIRNLLKKMRILWNFKTCKKEKKDYLLKKVRTLWKR